MANPQPTEPEVRHERKDIEVATVFWSGVGFAILASASTGFAMWLSTQLLREKPPARDPGLPRAAVDGKERPPEPRLEALEDLDAGKLAELLPPRAAWHRETETPAPTGSVNLKSRKEPAPLHFSTRLPSKASAGRTETGGGS